jgi:hypothetical protein
MTRNFQAERLQERIEELRQQHAGDDNAFKVAVAELLLKTASTPEEKARMEIVLNAAKKLQRVLR